MVTIKHVCLWLFCRHNLKAWLPGLSIRFQVVDFKMCRVSLNGHQELAPVFLYSFYLTLCKEDIRHTLCSDFVTNSYGESWDSSCEKSLSITNKSQFKYTLSPKLKMLYVTRQLIWRQTTKLFITVY